MVESIGTLLFFAERVKVIDKKQDPKSTPQRCYAALLIKYDLDSLIRLEEKIARQDQDVEWIKKLKNISQSANAMIDPVIQTRGT